MQPTTSEDGSSLAIQNLIKLFFSLKYDIRAEKKQSQDRPHTFQDAENLWSNF
jgi:hypothetical protein